MKQKTVKLTNLNIINYLLEIKFKYYKVSKAVIEKSNLFISKSLFSLSAYVTICLKLWKVGRC